MPDPGVLRSFSLFSEQPVPSVRPRLRSLGIYEATGDYVYRRHQHIAYEVIVVTRGLYRCQLNGEAMSLRPSQVLLVKPLDWHEDFLNKRIRYWAVSFTLEDASVGSMTGWFRPGIQPSQQVCSLRGRGVLALLERMRDESASPDALSLLVQDAMLGELVWRLARLFPPQVLAPGLTGISEEDSFPRRLERWFESHLYSQMNVSGMAAAMGMSPTTLGVRCRRLLGLSPARAFVRFKLERAKLLLARTTMTVTEVSGHLEFENPYHFSRAFKRHFGLPPSRLKREV